VDIWGDKDRLLLEDPSFGDGVSAQLFGGDGTGMDIINDSRKPIAIQDDFYQVPGTDFSKENCPPYMVSMGWMFQDMVKTIREGGVGSPNFAEALHAHKVVEAAIESSRSGRWG